MVLRLLKKWLPSYRFFGINDDGLDRRLQNEDVRAEYAALPFDMQARFNRIAQLIETQGLERVREPHVKHLEDRLWEIRMTGRDGIARAIYVTASGKRQTCGGGAYFRQENTKHPTP